MTRYRGKLDGIWQGRLAGWAVNIDDPNDKPTVMVLVNDQVVAVGRADLMREDLVDQGYGDGAYGFSIDLAPHLNGARASTDVDVLIGPTAWVLPGSPLCLTAPAQGHIDFWRDDRICGWAHVEGYQRARLEVLQDGKFILAWPCNKFREDLARLKIGDGTFGFEIPISRLCGGNVENLSFRIEGTAVMFSAPRHERAIGEQMTAAIPAPRFADAAEARRAILKTLDRPIVSRANVGAGVRLSFAALQNLLNELSYFENRLRDEERRAALLAEKSHSAAPRKQVKIPRNTQLWTPFNGLLHTTESPDAAELKRRVEQEIVPLYAGNRKSRAAFEDAVRSCRNPNLLGSIVAGFRAHDYLSVPAVAYGAKLRSNATVNAQEALELRRLESWANCIDFRNIPRRRLKRVQPGKPRALYVFWSCLPYDTNGYCTRSHYLLRALNQIGESVAGLTRLGYPWDSNQGGKPAGDMVEAFDGAVYFHLGGPQANRRLIPLESYIDECADRIAHVAAIVGADLIHSTSNWMVGLPALIAARRIGRPFCYEMRGIWELTRASNRPGYELSDHYDLFRKMEALTAREADLVLTITPQVRDDLARRGVDTARMRPAPNGVDTSRFKPTPKDPELKAKFGIKDEVIFGFVGSFAEYEGLIDACRAALHLRERNLPFKLLLVGDGAVFEEVRQFCAEHGLEEIVVLTGRVPFTEAPRYYSLVDVALAPRIPVMVTEMVAPLKPFEAMAMGKPVIGSDVAPLAEIIREGKTGWLFPKGEVSALGSLMARVVESRHHLPEMGAAARDFVVQTHDWKTIARNIATAWDDLRDTEAHLNV
jgi:glycosyltransferase involved in cell wall biosynthesis